MSKAQICLFATSMGVGSPPRTIPHASLTEFDLRVDDPILPISDAPLHDHYGEESNADTDFQDHLDFSYQVIELNVEDDPIGDLEELAA